MRPLETYQALYLYGSRVYGTNRHDSDWDYVGIKDGVGYSEMDRGVINVKLMDPKHFQRLLFQHHITALECYYLPEEYVVTAPLKPWDFKLDLAVLRHSLSEKSNQSFVKAKKKFVAPYDWALDEILRGKKSLFHSFRILDFGIQIAIERKIVNYNSCNHIYHEIMNNDSLNWDDYQERWKGPYNQLASEFRRVAPK